MKNLPSLALVSLVSSSLLAGCLSGDNESVDEPLDVDASVEPEPEPGPEPQPDPQPEPKFLPASCHDISQRDPAAVDGDYTLYIGNDESKPWTAYCHDLANGGLEYLSLTTLPGRNTSSYEYGGAASGTTVVTTYSKIRIDPSNLAVDIGDQTFAVSKGQITHPGGITVTSMPYAVAMSCSTNWSGAADIDLSGTSMALADTFVPRGHVAHGSVTVFPGNKEAVMSGGGYCGWIGPDSAYANPFNAPTGMSLQLTYRP